MRAITRATSSARELRPEHALLTPLWLGALALLVANDHWLKGSGLLPGVLTGKLSDFAGMIVAPVLLASLLCVGTRRGLLACHVAVVLVFAGIQLSPAFAQLWSGLMGLVGHPWVITCDPTDLIAVPFAWVSWRSLTPAMDPERPAMVGLRRSAVAAASVFGLWATVATSDDSGDCRSCWNDEGISSWGTDTDDGWDETDGGWESVTGHVYIHNPNDFDISITIRTLSPTVVIDCAELGSDPGRLLPDDAFGPAEHWLLPPTTNVAITFPFECGAAKVGGEGIQEQIVFNQFGGGPGAWQSFPGSHDSLDELEALGAGIVMGPEGSSWTGGESWRYTPKTDTVPLPEHCTPAPNEQRIDWSSLPADVVVQVLSKTQGLDGCFEFELAPWVGNGYGPSFAWYLCAPESSVRLEPDSIYQLVTTTTVTQSVEARLVDPTFFVPMTNDNGQPLFLARWVRGIRDATWITDVAAVGLPASTCPWEVVEGCPIVERKLGLGLGNGTIEVVPGLTKEYIDSVSRHEFTLGRARSLALVDGGCASGSRIVPHDIDYALITEPLVP